MKQGCAPSHLTLCKSGMLRSQVMNKRVYIQRIRRCLSFLACMLIFLIALPCNCMAAAPVETSQSDHPCHAPADSASDNQEQHSDGSCCCSDSNSTMVMPLTPEAVSSEAMSEQFLIPSLISQVHSYQDRLQLAAVNGSPPTDSNLILSKQIYLALLQSWLI